ncbi:MAG: hypothetical protein ACI9D0_000162 [Bacteroidia bacterium]|jgi:hypothetical protein
MITMNCKSIFGVLFGTAALVVGLQFSVLAGTDPDAAAGSDPRLLSSDQDLVGTLPALYPGDPDDTSTGEVGLGKGDRATSMKPSFVLIGTMEKVRESILDAYGVGYVMIEETASTQSTGIYEFSFHGEVIVAVDRYAIESQQVTTRLRVGLDYLGGFGAVDGNGYSGRAFPLSSHEINLPYGSILKSNLADDVTVGLELANQGMDTAYVGVVAYGSTAQIELIAN